MDHRRAVAGDHHRAGGGVQVKAVLALVLASAVAFADAPGQTPAKPDAAPLPPNIERVEPSPNARTEAWVATGVTAVIVGIGVYSVVRMKQTSDDANDVLHANGEPTDWTAAQQSTDHWFHATLLFGGLSVASVAVTGILWSRTQPSYRVSVTPQGAYVGYARSF